MTSDSVCDKTRKRDLAIESAMFTLARVENQSMSWKEISDATEMEVHSMWYLVKFNGRPLCVVDLIDESTFKINVV